MASLKDIRRRIGSVKNTQQITKAMKMVAASRLRRAQDMITGARPFAEKIEEFVHRILNDITGSMEAGVDVNAALVKLHPLLRSVDTLEGKRVALLIVSSDKGLCGAYNSNVIKNAWKVILELQKNKDCTVDLYFAGKKAYDSFKSFDGKRHLFEGFWSGSFNNTKTDGLAKFFVEKFEAGELDVLKTVYTEFKSVITQEVHEKTLLPLGVSLEAESGSKAISAESGTSEQEDALPYIYKPGREYLLKSLLPAQFQSNFFRCCADSLASELGSRMTSMDNATRNAGDMIDKLSLQANRLRQASITTELMEIVGGAEALKG